MNSQRHIRASELSTATNLDGRGVYAWYYFPEITKPDLNDVVSKLSSEDQNVKEQGVKEALEFIRRDFYAAYLYQRNWVATKKGAFRIPGSGVTPKFEVKMREIPNDHNLETNSSTTPEYWNFGRNVSNNARSLFLSPLYIGKTGKQSFKKRLMDYVKEIDELNKTLKETGPAERDNWFKSQSNKLRGFWQFVRIEVRKTQA